MCTTEQKPVFRDLSADDPDPEVTEIESFCVNCHANGMTRLLLTRIPHYKNIVLMSFSCEECGFENNEIQPGGAFAELGIKWVLRVETPADLNRQVVKSDYTSARVPEIDLEVPAKTQKGEITTVEGIVSRAALGLAREQAARRALDPRAADQIDAFLLRLRALLALETPWTLELTDISGNCFIENPEAPRKDPRCERKDFKRTKEEDHQLGIFTHEEVEVAPSPASSLPGALTPSDPLHGTFARLAADEVLHFPTNCPECNAPAETNMKVTDIPHFKQVVIMATICDACGHRTNEVKSGGGVEAKGVRFEVRIASREDFSRDVLKSETCSMSVPELELEVGGRALGGRFSTPEGLLRAALLQLAEAPALGLGDAPAPAAGRMREFMAKVEEVLEGRRAVTLVLDDPAGNSYVQNLSDDPAVYDDGLKVTHYERSFEQNDELGLNDMKTEGYEADS